MPSRASSISSRQQLILWLACSAVFFEAFDVSIVNLALPSMSRDLQVSLAETQWVQTLYLLTFGGFLLLGGRLCDHWGSKKIFLAGMSLFCAASGMAAIHWPFALLLIARALQGVGAALAIPGGISLLSRHFTDEGSRNKALSIFGAFAAVGFASGLASGGVIAGYFDWHWIFGVNIPVIVPVVFIGATAIPAEALSVSGRLNIWSACWLTATLLLACYTIHELPRLGITRSMILVLVTIGSGVGVSFFDRRSPHPFFDKNIYPSSSSHYVLAASAMLGAAFLGYIFLVTAAIYQVLRWNAQDTGLLLFPYSIASAFVSRLILPVLFRRLGTARVARLALWLLLAGLLLLIAGIQTGRLVYFITSLFLVNSLAIAIGYPALSILNLADVAPGRQGLAAGLQTAIYTSGTGVGLSVIGFCLLAASDGRSPASSSPLALPCVVICLLAATGIIMLSFGRKPADKLLRR